MAPLISRIHISDLLVSDTVERIRQRVTLLVYRDSIGSSAVIGDERWAGAYGVEADFIALTHCSVEFIPTESINVIVS